MENYEQCLPRASVNKEECKRGQKLPANTTGTSSLLRREGPTKFKYDDVHHKFITD
jgi:hypothetical protein